MKKIDIVAPARPAPLTLLSLRTAPTPFAAALKMQGLTTYETIHAVTGVGYAALLILAPKTWCVAAREAGPANAFAPLALALTPWRAAHRSGLIFLGPAPTPMLVFHMRLVGVMLTHAHANLVIARWGNKGDKANKAQLDLSTFLTWGAVLGLQVIYRDLWKPEMLIANSAVAAVMTAAAGYIALGQ